MSAEALAQAGSVALSLLALVLSLANLYLQRRDRRPRLEIRARYEYRARAPEGASGDGEDPAPPQVHDDTQEGLYLLLGDFLREYGLEYPQGTPLVRFALSNKGERAVYLNGVRLVFRAGGRRSGDRMVLDPASDRVLPFELAQDSAANILGTGGGSPVELVPGDGVGYRFELTRLANTLKREGHAGDVEISLEATDRLGNVYRRPFSVNTDLWAFPR